MNPDGESIEVQIERLELENERLRAEVISLRQFIDSMQNLLDAVESPMANAEIMELLSQVLENAMETIGVRDGSLLVLDEDTDELVFVLAHGAVPSEDIAWRRLPPGEGIAGWVVKNQRATIVNDVSADDRFYRGVDEELDFHTDSILAAPIVGGGRVLGVVEMLNKRDGALFSAGDQTLLTLMCRFAGELLYTVVKQASSAGPLPG